MSVKEKSFTGKPARLNLSVNWSPHLPAVTWRGLFLTTPKEDVLDLSALPLAEALGSCRAEESYLGFLEACRFLEKNFYEESAGEIRSLEEKWHFRWNEESKELSVRFLELPSNFQEWAAEKKMAFNDLRPLLRGEFPTLLPFLELFKALQVSKSGGADLLEKLCDQTAWELAELSFLLERPEAIFWSEILDKKIRPVISAKDQERSEKIRRWPWPARVQGRWTRQGDQAGLHVELNCFTPEEFSERLKSLEDFARRWKEEL
jgi:hypothetical protein